MPQQLLTRSELQARLDELRARRQQRQLGFATPAGQEEVREPDEVLEPEGPSGLDLLFETHPAFTQRMGRAADLLTRPKSGESPLQTRLKKAFRGVAGFSVAQVNPFGIAALASAPLKGAAIPFKALSAVMAGRGALEAGRGVAEGDLARVGSGAATAAFGVLGSRGLIPRGRPLVGPVPGRPRVGPGTRQPLPAPLPPGTVGARQRFGSQPGIQRSPTRLTRPDVAPVPPPAEPGIGGRVPRRGQATRAETPGTPRVFKPGELAGMIERRRRDVPLPGPERRAILGRPVDPTQAQRGQEFVARPSVVPGSAEARRIQGNVQEFPEHTRAFAQLGRLSRTAREEFKNVPSAANRVRMREAGKQLKTLERELRAGKDVSEQLSTVERAIPAPRAPSAELARLEQRVQVARQRVKNLQVQAQSEALGVGPVHQALEQARKASKGLGFQLSALRKSELGAVAPVLGARIGSSILGGVVGGATGGEDQDLEERMIRIAVGATAGFFTPDVLRKIGQSKVISGPVVSNLFKAFPKAQNVGERLQQFRYFNLLSRPATIIRASSGSIGGTTLAGLERAAEGVATRNPRQIREGLEILKTMVTDGPKVWMRALRDPSIVQIPGRVPGRIAKGWVGAPTRLINAADQAGVHAMTKNGAYTVDQAARFTLAGKPTTELGNTIVDSVNKHWQLQIVLPFPRVGTQIIERGLERTPGIGFLNIGDDASISLKIIRQLEGLGIGVAAALGGEKLAESLGFEPQSFAPFIIAAAGTAALPVAAGLGLRELIDRRGTAGEPVTAGDVASSLVTTATEEAPLIGAPEFRPSRLLTQLTPGILGDVTRTFDVERDVRGEGVTAPLRSRIPGLRQTVPEAEAQRDIFGAELREGPETGLDRLRLFLAQPRRVRPQERTPEGDPLAGQLTELGVSLNPPGPPRAAPSDIESFGLTPEPQTPEQLAGFEDPEALQDLNLEPEQEEVFFEATGTALRALLERRIGSERFQSLQPFEQAAILRETATRARKLVRDRALRELRGDGFTLDELLEPVRRLRPLR